MVNQRLKSVSRKRKFAADRFTNPKQSENVQTCSELKLNYLKDTSQNNECHCCSTREKPMYGQYPIGADSWFKRSAPHQRSKANGKQFLEKSAGLSANTLNVVKSEYMKLCDKQLFSHKCLQGKTQNANESFNEYMWQIAPKETFIELITFSLGAYIAFIIFNKCFNGFL
ncbi:uncharacterized protein TNCV_2050601 [Trichonephila clavipes]|nr:uncharacterized protein TNCV_2050601 [Trichonephila clavipes]